MKSFLSNRTQTVLFNGLQSNTVTLGCGIPQESVLGPLSLVFYTADVLEIAAKHGISIQCFADDIQPYVLFTTDNMQEAAARMLKCISEIKKWMSSNRFKLNPEKSQFIWLGTWQQLRRFAADPFTMPSGIIITPTMLVRDLGCTLNSKLTMEDHVNTIVSWCMFQLRQLRTIRLTTLLHSQSMPLLPPN